MFESFSGKNEVIQDFNKSTGIGKRAQVGCIINYLEPEEEA